MYETKEIEAKYNDFIEAATKEIKPSREKIGSSVEKIIEETECYVKEAGLESLVIGVSGGLDSAVVAAIARKVCDNLNIKLIGLSIPLSSSFDHREKANFVGNKYCDSFKEMVEWEEGSNVHNQVNEVIESTNDVIEESGFDSSKFNNKVAQGNIKARLRMISLYRVAGVSNGAVLSTDNYSEYFLGFWTLQGDVGDISPIQFVGKGIEEIEMAKFLGIREDIISQKPSDGLNVSDEDTDEAQLGMSYQEVDPIMFAYMGMLSEENIKKYNEIKSVEKVKNIIKRHEKTAFKRNGPFYVQRERTGL